MRVGISPCPAVVPLRSLYLSDHMFSLRLPLLCPWRPASGALAPTESCSGLPVRPFALAAARSRRSVLRTMLARVARDSVRPSAPAATAAALSSAPSAGGSRGSCSRLPARPPALAAAPAALSSVPALRLVLSGMALPAAAPAPARDSRPSVFPGRPAVMTPDVGTLCWNTVT